MHILVNDLPSLLIFTSPANCPAGLVKCFANPCSGSSCSNYPSATCIPNFCGGCNAHFFYTGRNVTDRCDDVCEDGMPTVACYSNPCMGASCPAVPSATCTPNYCGGCNHKFFDTDGVDVTSQCSRCKFSSDHDDYYTLFQSKSNL